MNKISFTGIRNIGAINTIMVHNPAQRPTVNKCMVINLTNDIEGNDLDNFKAIKNKCKESLNGFTFPHDPNFIHICTKKEYDSNNIPKLYLNLKEVPVKRETLPMFSYIAKLLKRISNTDNKDMYTAFDFKYGEDADLYLLGEHKLSHLMDKNTYLSAIEEAFNPEFIKHQAQSINKDIEEQMRDYFA